MLKIMLKIITHTLNWYLKSPFKFDLISACLLTWLSYYFYKIGFYKIPKDEFIINVSSEIANVSLGASSLFLTILTIIIAFKNSVKIKNGLEEKFTTLDIFFLNNFLYQNTIRNIKSCLTNSLLLTLLGFILRITLMHEFVYYLYFYSCFASAIICLSYFRITSILYFILRKDKVADDEQLK